MYDLTWPISPFVDENEQGTVLIMKVRQPYGKLTSVINYILKEKFIKNILFVQGFEVPYSYHIHPQRRGLLSWGAQARKW